MRLSAPVVGIEQGDREVRVRIRTGETVSARTAVWATPLNTWTDVEFAWGLNEGKRRAAEQRHPGRTTKIYMVARNVPANLYGVSGTAGFSLVEDEAASDVDGARLMFAMADDTRVDVTDHSALQETLRVFAPDAEILATDYHDWNGDEYSQGTWMIFRPGQMTSLGPALHAPEGRVFFAGSDVTPRWSGNMEGAFETGMWAARGAIRMLGSSP